MTEWWLDHAKKEIDIQIEQYDKHLITRPDLVKCLLSLIQQERGKN